MTTTLVDLVFDDRGKGKATVSDDGKTVVVGEAVQGRDGITRFPRRYDTKPNGIATKAKVHRRINALVEKIITLINLHRKARIQIGHACTQLKKLVGHGNWQPFFKDTLAPCGLKLRTAEVYMLLAREAHEEAEISKTAEPAIFPPAVSERAREMNEATKQAEADVTAAKQQEHKRRSSHLYRLALQMPDAEIAALNALHKLPDWRPHIERRVRRFLRKLCREFGITTKDIAKKN